MTQKILCFSGRKQSGKNTSANFIVGQVMQQLGICKEALITPKGELWVSDIFGDEDKGQGILDLYNTHPEVVKFLDDELHPYVKLYSFADILKRDVCMGVLGLSEKQCYGTDADKNTKTHLKWENMPGVITEILPDVDPEDMEQLGGRLGPYYQKLKSGVVYHKPGLMTAREVLQFVGTEIFRKMWGEVWAESTIKRIQDEGSLKAIITDCRFPNEVFATQKAGGKVIRFTRNPAGNSDVHESETALDKDKFDWSNFDAIIENSDCSIELQNIALVEALTQWDDAENLVVASK